MPMQQEKIYNIEMTQYEKKLINFEFALKIMLQM